MKVLFISLIAASVLTFSASADGKTTTGAKAKQVTTTDGTGKTTTTSGSITVEHNISDNTKVHGTASHSQTNSSNGGTETSNSVEVGIKASF